MGEGGFLVNLCGEIGIVVYDLWGGICLFCFFYFVFFFIRFLQGQSRRHTCLDVEKGNGREAVDNIMDGEPRRRRELHNCRRYLAWPWLTGPEGDGWFPSPRCLGLLELLGA